MIQINPNQLIDLLMDGMAVENFSEELNLNFPTPLLQTSSNCTMWVTDIIVATRAHGTVEGAHCYCGVKIVGWSFVTNSKKN